MYLVEASFEVPSLVSTHTFNNDALLPYEYISQRFTFKKLRERERERWGSLLILLQESPLGTVTGTEMTIDSVHLHYIFEMVKTGKGKDNWTSMRHQINKEMEFWVSQVKKEKKKKNQSTNTNNNDLKIFQRTKWGKMQ